jgi:hypothetical protein
MPWRRAAVMWRVRNAEKKVRGGGRLARVAVSRRSGAAGARRAEEMRVAAKGAACPRGRSRGWEIGALQLRTCRGALAPGRWWQGAGGTTGVTMTDPFVHMGFIFPT